MVKICVSISELDFKFIKSNNLRPTWLLRSKIDELKENIDPTDLKESIKRFEAWKDRAERLSEFIKQEGLINKWLEKEDM